MGSVAGSGVGGPSARVGAYRRGRELPAGEEEGRSGLAHRGEGGGT